MRRTIVIAILLLASVLASGCSSGSAAVHDIKGVSDCEKGFRMDNDQDTLMCTVSAPDGARCEVLVFSNGHDMVCPERGTGDICSTCDTKTNDYAFGIKGRSQCQRALSIEGSPDTAICVIQRPGGNRCYALDYSGGQSLACPPRPAANEDEF